METVSRIFRESSQSFFLFGPRGTGKSTWLKAKYPNAELIDLLAPEVFRTYAARPERLRELVAGSALPRSGFPLCPSSEIRKG